MSLVINHEHVYLALTHLIDAAEESGRMYLDNLPVVNWLAFAKEFKTVRICGARRTGHTCAMLRVISERFPRSLVVGATKHQHEAQIRRCKEMDLELPNAMFTYSKKCLDRSRGYGFDAIFFDPATFVSKSVVNDLYLIYSVKDGPFFVFMQ